MRASFMLPSADIRIYQRYGQPHYRTLLDCWGAIEKRATVRLFDVAGGLQTNDGEQRVKPGGSYGNRGSHAREPALGAL